MSLERAAWDGFYEKAEKRRVVLDGYVYVRSGLVAY